MEETEVFQSIDKLISGEPEPTVFTGRVRLVRAPNQVIFIESPDFLSGPNPLWPEQYRIVRDFFELLCPNCNDTEKIQNSDEVPRGQQILFEFDTCPQCGLHKRELKDKLRYYNTLVGVVGMRSGKSATVASMVAAHLHNLLCYESLPARLGMVSSQTLDIDFVAAGQRQAEKTIYGHFRGLYDHSPWFQNYRRQLMDLEVTDHNLRRGDLYWENDTEIEWFDKFIRVCATHTNSGTLAGPTRLAVAFDELSRLDAGDSKRSATEVYRVLENSLLTVRASCARLREEGEWIAEDGLMLSVSSPIFLDDKSMQLLKTATRVRRMYSFHMPTWEFNPTISKERDLAEAYEKDPIGAERDFGANPPGAENPFIDDPVRVDLCEDKKRPSILQYREVAFDATATNGVQTVQYHYIRPEFLGMRINNLARYAVHCDPGETGDSFCLAVGHRDNDLCVIDAALEMRPIKYGVQRSVHFPSIVNFIKAMNRTTKLLAASYDRWNSTDHIQELIDEGIVAFKKNLSRDDHIAFRNACYSGKVRFPAAENGDPQVDRNIPCAKAIHELKRLNDSGIKVDHPPNGSNDMIQCYIGVYRILMTPMTSTSRPTLMQKTMSPASLQPRMVRFRR